MSKNAVIVEGFITYKQPWKDGWCAIFNADGGKETIAFTHPKAPKENVRVRVEGNRGKFWIFADKWEYLAPPPGKTNGDFPVKGDSEIEDAFIRRIRILSEFSADDFHTPEILDLTRQIGRDKRVFGSILRKFNTEGWIKEIRYIHSKRKACHGRPIVLWTRTVKFDKMFGEQK